MQIYREKYKVIIISQNLSNFLSRLLGFKKDVGMGFSIFPFLIILRNKNHPMTKQWINHESIHLRQHIESLGLFWVYSELEYLYARIFLKYSHMEAYKNKAIEQEAYLNQNDPNYLSQRPVFSTIKFMKTKTKFDINKDYQVVIQD